MSYQTEQKKLVREFLEKNSENSYSIAQLSNELHFFNNGLSIPGKSSIYRIINSLLETGFVRRFTKAPDKTFYYQATCKHSEEHLHLVCTKCNKLYHLDKETSKELKNELNRKFSFSLDSKATLTGKCETCK